MDRIRIGVVGTEYVGTSFAYLIQDHLPRGEAEPMIIGDDGLAALRIALAVEESARQRAAVRL